MSTSESRSARVLELAEQFLESYRQGERPSLKGHEGIIAADFSPDGERVVTASRLARGDVRSACGTSLAARTCSR